CRGLADADALLDHPHELLVRRIVLAGARIEHALSAIERFDVMEVVAEHAIVLLVVDEADRVVDLGRHPAEVLVSHRLEETSHVPILAVGRKAQEVIEARVLEELLDAVEHRERSEATEAPGLRRSRDDREHLASGDSTPAFVLRAVDSLELAFGLLELVPHAKNRRAEELPLLFGEAIGRLAAVVEDRLLDRPELLHDRPKRLLVVLGSRTAQTREDGPKRRDGRGMRRDLPPARV